MGPRSLSAVRRVFDMGCSVSTASACSDRGPAEGDSRILINTEHSQTLHIQEDIPVCLLTYTQEIKNVPERHFKVGGIVLQP